MLSSTRLPDDELIRLRRGGGQPAGVKEFRGRSECFFSFLFFFEVGGERSWHVFPAAKFPGMYSSHRS